MNAAVSPGRLRFGFTLVELLVTIAIIAMLVSLLVPSIQAAREAARQTQCRNNLKQISLACLNYESSHGELPGYAGEGAPSNVGGIAAGGPIAPEGNWVIQALAFMEEASLSDALRQLSPASDLKILRRPTAQAAIQTPVPSLHCPTRRDAIAYPLVRRWGERFGPRGARTDYAMNGGASTSNSSNSIHVAFEGVWRMAGKTHLKKITDGTSKTYMVGEKAMDSERYTTGTDLGDLTPLAGWHNRQRGVANSYVRFGARKPGPDGRGNCLICHDFGSAHRENWNAAMCDGSVRSVAYAMHVSLHRALASIDGEEPLGDLD